MNVNFYIYNTKNNWIPQNKRYINLLSCKIELICIDLRGNFPLDDLVTSLLLKGTYRLVLLSLDWIFQSR